MFGWGGGGEEAPLNFSPINTYNTPDTCRVILPLQTCCTALLFIAVHYNALSSAGSAVCVFLPGAALKANWRVTNSQSLSRLGSYGTYNTFGTFGTCGSQALTFGTNDIYGTCTHNVAPMTEPTQVCTRYIW